MSKNVPTTYLWKTLNLSRIAVTFPKVRWKVDEESGSVLPLNVTTDLKKDVIGGLFGCGA
jgi:hypothetical protein